LKRHCLQISPDFWNNLPALPKRFQLLVFDWDGTLVDSTGAIAVSLQAACRDMGCRVPDDAAARYVIGLGLQEALTHVAPDLEVARYSTLVERYRYHYLTQEGTARLFPGVAAALVALRDAGHSLAVATGKSRRGLDRVMEETGLRACFQATRCADEGPSKPDPAMLHWLMTELGVDPSQTIMIGDTTHDMAMAHAAGVAALAVSYGAHPRANLLEHQPIDCLERSEDLWSWLQQQG